MINFLKNNKIKNKLPTISIVGTNGIPARYGGFETLAENLADFEFIKQDKQFNLAVYCSGKRDILNYKNTELRYINIKANGINGIFYDIFSIFDAIKRGDQSILILGLSGALIIPFIRLVSKVKLIVNVDGIEWKREKWGFMAKIFLKISEYIAVKFAHQIVTDNLAITEYIKHEYSSESIMIAYGGDHAINCDSKNASFTLPKEYALSICRIEPENNIEMILESFSRQGNFKIIFIGNWNSSNYGRFLKSKYKIYENIIIIDPIYDLSILKDIRSNAACYIHGHSAGGTNPSLVEMMYFDALIMAFDCSFNRHTTNNEAVFFKNMDELICCINNFSRLNSKKRSTKLKEIAKKDYSWKMISEKYFELFK